MMRLRISLRAIFCLGLSLSLSSCGSRRQVSETSIDSRLISRIETMIDEVMDRKIVEIKTSDLNADIVITERAVSYTHLRAHETVLDIVPRVICLCPRRQIPISSLAGGTAR